VIQGVDVRTTMDQGLEEIELELLLQGILRRYGFDFRDGEPAFLRGRVARLQAEEGAGSISALLERILRDPPLMERFVDAMAGPPGPLFQPPGFWKAVRKKVLPFLRTYPRVRVWQVGGATGGDLPSLSILLAEDFPRKFRIYATEIHEALAARARSGKLPGAQVARARTPYRRSGGRGKLERYFEARNGDVTLDAALQKKIVYAAHNPATDGAFNEFHLVMCRNLLGTYNGALKGRAFRLLHESLVTLGFLALGPRDDLAGSPHAAAYKAVDRKARIYQKMRE
jgi:chemotaxis protein methyltransferase CheR